MKKTRTRVLRSEDELISKMTLGFLFAPLVFLALIAAMVAI